MHAKDRAPNPTPASLRTVVLISGRGSNLKALLDAQQQSGDIADFVGVISNRPQAPGLAHAKAANIPYHIVDDQGRFDQRQTYDQGLAKAIDHYRPELIILAGFMRILSAPFVQRYQGRMINIHPSLLPKYPGRDTHQRAIDAGDNEHGASVHFVAEQVDAGPVIAQTTVPILADDDAQTLATRLLEKEHRLYPEVVRWFNQGRIHWQGTELIIDGQPQNPTKPLRI